MLREIIRFETAVIDYLMKFIIQNDLNDILDCVNQLYIYYKNLKKNVLLTHITL